ncbi:type II toxin-antitoxin system RelE family toxin [Pectobacterium sp. B2J-2]|uniref:type II toxin-antitoxin system RelE family toxin n=1 Tax=Pectobacterium sp. B2J-2 TaxID=3385372 RepID=UPI0038FD2E2F
MNYRVKFREEALKEWLKLDTTIQQQFAKKLKKCCENPHAPSAKLREMKDCYKIKLRTSGFRLVYEVIDHILVIAVVAVDKRERSGVYHLASERMRLSHIL